MARSWLDTNAHGNLGNQNAKGNAGRKYAIDPEKQKAANLLRSQAMMGNKNAARKREQGAGRPHRPAPPTDEE